MTQIDVLLSSGALQGLTDVGTLPTWAAMFGHTFHEALSILYPLWGGQAGVCWSNHFPL